LIDRPKGESMHSVRPLEYLSVGAHNLVEAVEFYSRVVRLDRTQQVGGTAFVTGGPGSVVESVVPR
jgi:hypothetical protein